MNTVNYKVLLFNTKFQTYKNTVPLSGLDVINFVACFYLLKFCTRYVKTKIQSTKLHFVNARKQKTIVSCHFLKYHSGFPSMQQIQ
jgi:hypothetical protein